MEAVKNIVPWSIRILISALFLVSAYAKIYPDPSFYFSITKFEFSQLYPMGFSPELAVYLSRGLIGIEFALGFLLLFPFNLKKIVIPVTIIMLAVFSVHLSIEILSGNNGGNCGCFGSLIPMTPLQALIKNLISIGLLSLLLFKFSDGIRINNNFLAVSNITTICILFLFMLIPIQKKITAIAPMETEIIEPVSEEVVDTNSIDTNRVLVVDVKPVDMKVEEPKGPAKKASGYTKYFPKIDEGKKILCFFAPTCEHCMQTAKELVELKKTDSTFPEVQIVFMDEAPEEISAFFRFAGAEYKYMVMDIVAFWTALGSNKDTPGVVYLWNGNTLKFYNGTEGKDKFNKAELKKLVKKESY